MFNISVTHTWPDSFSRAMRIYAVIQLSFGTVCGMVYLSAKHLYFKVSVDRAEVKCLIYMSLTHGLTVCQRVIRFYAEIQLSFGTVWYGIRYLSPKPLFQVVSGES